MIELGDFHSLAEARSWALHREVAARLATHPELLDQAKRRVAEWLASVEGHPYARAWGALLQGSPQDLHAVLVGKDDWSCTLRQASPFAGALDSSTRWRILKQPELRPREKT